MIGWFLMLLIQYSFSFGLDLLIAKLLSCGVKKNEKLQNWKITIKRVFICSSSTIGCTCVPPKLIQGYILTLTAAINKIMIETFNNNT